MFPYLPGWSLRNARAPLAHVLAHLVPYLHPEHQLFRKHLRQSHEQPSEPTSDVREAYLQTSRVAVAVPLREKFLVVLAPVDLPRPHGRVVVPIRSTDYSARADENASFAARSSRRSTALTNEGHLRRRHRAVSRPSRAIARRWRRSRRRARRVARVARVRTSSEASPDLHHARARDGGRRRRHRRAPRRAAAASRDSWRFRRSKLRDPQTLHGSATPRNMGSFRATQHGSLTSAPDRRG